MHYEPWTNPTIYEVNHNITNLLEAKKYVKIRQKDKDTQQL